MYNFLWFQAILTWNLKNIKEHFFSLFFTFGNFAHLFIKHHFFLFTYYPTIIVLLLLLPLQILSSNCYTYTWHYKFQTISLLFHSDIILARLRWLFSFWFYPKCFIVIAAIASFSKLIVIYMHDNWSSNHYASFLMSYYSTKTAFIVLLLLLRPFICCCCRYELL